MRDENAAARALREVAPQELPSRLLAEAERIAGGKVAVYVIDVDGSCFLRLAGGSDLPESFPSPGAVGPELPLEALGDARAAAAEACPGCELVPIALRDRALGAFLTSSRPSASLAALADEAAVALELCNGYTDTVHSTRRRRRIDPAAEIQQNLLPPRLARVAGGNLAGGVLPGYDVGGDFFDYAQNEDGLWLAVGDGMGKGNNAAALASLALGALRASRRSDMPLAAAVSAMHATVYGTGGVSSFLTAIAAVWNAGSGVLTWVNAGHPPPLRLDAGGTVTELEGKTTYPLGLFRSERSFQVAETRLAPGDRLVLYSDGISERRNSEGASLGLEAIEAMLRPLATAPAARIVSALQEGVRAASSRRLSDDATLLVLALDD